MVRSVLNLSAGYYGAAESAMGVAAILGSLSVGFLTQRMKMKRLHSLLVVLGLCFIPAGAAFLLPGHVYLKYAVLVLAFCGGQIASTIFSVFALSAIQARTPAHLTGKVMAYVSTLSMCAQPLGQIAYGYLFDAVDPAAVLMPTGIVVCGIGLLSSGFFARLEETR